MSEKRGVMLCGHGSRSEEAVAEFAHLSEILRTKLPDYVVDYGYLEFARPILRDGLDAIRAQGVQHIYALPGMLMAAGHAKNDIPSVLNAYQEEIRRNEDPAFTIEYGRELAVDLKMLQAAGARVEEAVEKAGDHISRHDTLLMVVGRGASDPDANSNISKITRMLWEGMGFGWAETCYSGVTFPLVQPGLEHAAKLGFKRIIVFPYFLFTGILVDRIYDHTDKVAANHPEIEFVKAGYLNDHPHVIATFLDRLTEIQEGTGNMNCQMCKYRVQVLGFEEEVGLVQESHHHHVEGISGHGHEHAPHGGHDHHHPHGHRHDHGHDHDGGHDHHHHPYPQADHPLGPKSLLEKGG